MIVDFVVNGRCDVNGDVVHSDWGAYRMGKELMFFYVSEG